MDLERQNKVYDLLDLLEIKYRKVGHPPLFTEADNARHRINIGAVIFKNLFLKNKNSTNYYLLSIPLEKRANLKKVADLLNETRLSFAEKNELEMKLNIQPGSVSFLNIIDKIDTDVTFLIDTAVNTYELIGVHPNDNTATVVFEPSSITKIWDYYGAKYKFLDL
jgi:Ala-tRNA(Pro) deacylase